MIQYRSKVRCDKCEFEQEYAQIISWGDLMDTGWTIGSADLRRSIGESGTNVACYCQDCIRKKLK